jgi:dUTP pyrophosphatase
MKVKRLTETAKIPTKAYELDLGYDLYSDQTTVIKPRTYALVPTGIAIQLPHGFGALILDRGSVASNGLVTHAGVMDGGYLGEYNILFENINNSADVIIGKGQKIAQFVLIAIVEDQIEETIQPFLQTVRGSKGFGSSGE